MNSHFGILAIISHLNPKIHLSTTCVSLVAATEIEIAGDDNRYHLSKVGFDYCFEVSLDDFIIDSIISLPTESDEQFANRIMLLICAYK